MRVRVRRTEDGWVVDARGIGRPWAPGPYPTGQAAARAAWCMRDHGTPNELPDDYVVERQADGRTIYRLIEPSHDRIEEPPCMTT